MAPAGDDDPTADPLARSTGGTWSRASLRDLLRGRRVLMLDRERNRIPLPGWLDEATGAGQEHQDIWDGKALDIHPSDRLALVQTWRDVAHRTGEALHVRYRVGKATGLRWYDDVVLDLTGHDGLQFVVGRKDGGPADGLDEWIDVDSAFRFTSTPVTMTYLDALGTTMRAEGQVPALFGCSAAELVASDGLQFIDEEYHEACIALFTNAIAEPEHSHSARLKIRRTDGTNLFVETTLINRLTDDGIRAVIGLTHDITAQLAAEEAARVHVDQLRSSREEFEILANQAPSAVFRTNGDGEITFANRQWRCLVDEKDATNLNDIVADDDRAALGEMLRRLASSDGPGEAGIEVVSRDATRVLSITCQAVSGPADGSLRPVIGSMTDVTSTTRLRHLAQHDDLTGLFNRHGFDLRLDDALAEDPENVVVAFIDLDGFKSVNDEHGHDAGDAVLRTFADRLRDALRPTDDVARYGGDEFVILCRQASAGAERAVAGRLDQVLATAIHFTGGQWRPGASIGFARARAGEDPSAVLRRADEAMYASKRTVRAPGHHSLR